MAPKSKKSAKSNTIVEPKALDSEVQRQFETELCWCIQQLQGSLNSGNLNQKQSEESTKVLNILMSNSTSYIKKRQIMRVTFGDYRAKMSEEDTKLSKVLTNIKIKPVTANTKSVFMKKSYQNSGGSNLKVNFNSANADDQAEEDSKPVDNQVVDHLSKINLKPENLKKKYKFTESNNSFRFNFEDLSS